MPASITAPTRKNETGCSHKPPSTKTTMKAPVIVRLTRVPTSDILNDFLGCDHIVTVYTELYQSVDSVNLFTLVHRHSLYTIVHEKFNGDLTNELISVSFYDNPLTLHHSFTAGASGLLS